MRCPIVTHFPKKTNYWLFFCEALLTLLQISANVWNLLAEVAVGW